ncbi:acid-sensing ion channel 1-like [Montipora foliosa]|uniref:acid-sensing ion channel 1-like n=1 Tax=Montipora foliosa TaxID=591990 RepID=UPI0035F12156
MNVVHPESTAQKPLKTTAIKEKWNNYVENATLHGIQHVFARSAIFRRVLWGFFLLSGIGYFSYQCTCLVEKYFKYPVHTKISLKRESPIEFPAVTICNFNMFKKSLVDHYGFGNVGRYAQRDPGLQINESEIDWSQFENYSMSSLYSSGGHQMRYMIRQCVWIGEECTYRNFTPVLTSMGLCHTFNSGQDGTEILKVNNAGAKFGLNLLLDIEQDEYFGLVTKQAGLKVLIHHPQTPPMVDELGFAVAPGTSTFVAVQKRIVRTLEFPYESNCTEEPITNMRGYTKYTSSACLLRCHARYIVQNCGCRDVKLPPVDEAEECRLKQTAQCVFPKTDKFYADVGMNCSCPTPCEARSFKPVLSYAGFPNENYVPELLSTSQHRREFSKNFKTYYRNLLRQNYLELNVYFQELEVMIVEEQPAYAVESLLGEIGGQLGLCIGASLLSLLEFFDVLFSIFNIRFGFAR